MSQTVNETVLVQELTKYGFKAKDVYYNWSKKLPDAAKTPVVPGAVFEMEIFVSDGGKKYVNTVGVQVTTNAQVEQAEQWLKPAAKKAFKPSTKKADDSAMTREDWDAKDRRISRQGCIQVAVQVISPFEKAVELADEMLAYVNEK